MVKVIFGLGMILGAGMLFRIMLSRAQGTLIASSRFDSYGRHR